MAFSMDWTLGWGGRSRWVRTAAVAVAFAGCSDDGLNPQNDTSGTGAATAPTGGDDDQEGGSQGATSAASASGGSATGGADGMGSDGSDGTAGGTSTPVACTTDLDCQLVNDCCACGAAHVDETISCGEPPCFAPLCEAKFGATPMAVCEASECTIEWDCNDLFVVCDALAPECPEGMLPSVVEGCYSGSCVPAADCNAVPDCTWCTVEEACVQNETQVGTFFACEPMPPECGGVASCACLPSACNPELEVCTDTDDGVACTCPTC